jgi:hypothetical protein
LPHVWLGHGDALHDRIGSEFTLVSLRPAGASLDYLRRSFATFGAHLDILEIEGNAARDVYGCDLVLVRPDLHVVWRGDQLPANHYAIAATATGHA